ncbi:MAG: type I glyceraldehyde-3-phosphate dehydrogenase [candidate division Zixibacteria bacterium]|nr:type I glyceraldehyde-3-phosphate dehydrogenase [candidate division Zixibacteria bacterium]
MALRIGINGFGRIGRLVYRIAMQDGGIDIVGVNDITDAKTLAHLLKYDSVHRMLPDEVKVDGDNMIVGKQTTRIMAEREPAKLPWKELGADIVVESTGLFRKPEQAQWHIDAGAKKVLISAPAGKEIPTFVFGVNDGDYDHANHHIVSIGSCTTNCLSPFAKVILDKFGIEKGVMTTIHAYTNDQRILDLPHKDLRRARAAALSMIPTTTGAAKAVALVIPELEGRLDGLAIRVPTCDGSLVDLVCETKKEVTIDAVNAAVKESADGPMKGFLQYCTDPIVSVDVIGNSHSSVFDSLMTMVMDKKMLKVFSWYDNEYGFSCRMIDMVKKLAGN